jgi:hypothetical protein
LGGCGPGGLQRRVTEESGGEDLSQDLLAGEVMQRGEVVELLDGRQR